MRFRDRLENAKRERELCLAGGCACALAGNLDGTVAALGRHSSSLQIQNLFSSRSCLFLLAFPFFLTLILTDATPRPRSGEERSYASGKADQRS